MEDAYTKPFTVTGPGRLHLEDIHLGKGCQEHIQRTHGESQKRVGLRVGDGDGWGGEEWWEENGDNCMWTTIKNVKK